MSRQIRMSMCWRDEVRGGGPDRGGGGVGVVETWRYFEEVLSLES